MTVEFALTRVRRLSEDTIENAKDAMLVIALEILFIALLIFINGVLALSELAVVSSQKAQLKRRADRGSARARAALDLAKDPNRFLSTVQVGITLIGILAGTFGGANVADEIAALVRNIPALAPYAETIGLGAVVVIITYLTLIFGELVPKRLALNTPERLAALIARPMRKLSVLAAPVVHFLTFSTNATLRLLHAFGISAARSREEEEEGEDHAPLPSVGALRREIGRVLSRGNLSRERRVEVLRALEIEQVPVREIMIPRDEVVALSTAVSLEENLRLMRTRPYNRYPLVGDGLDEMRGILYTTAVFRALDALEDGATTLADVAAPPMAVPADLAVSDLIDRFQAEGQELAFVTGAQGDVLGIVTTTDAFEAIAGELEDPADRA